MKSSSIAADDGDVDEERGAREADTPIYNALKPSMRMIRARLTHTARIYTRVPPPPSARSPDIPSDRFTSILSRRQFKCARGA